MNTVPGGKITLLSYHGKYVSAQPDGRIVVDRERALGWEQFRVVDGAHAAPVPAPRSVTFRSNDVFPSNLAGSVWTWAHNGTKPNGIIEFLPDGGTKWFNGGRQGYWKLQDGGKVLETEFNGVHHKLEYVASEKKAVLRSPERSPCSQMWIQGDRGLCFIILKTTFGI